jgi:hypothetical protein
MKKDQKRAILRCRRGAQPLEGSRFVIRQLCNLAASGSREWPSVRFCPSRQFRAGDATGHRTATPRNVPGSRPLQTDRATILQSGSPPGVGQAMPLGIHDADEKAPSIE